MNAVTVTHYDADVLIAGAGPAGSTCAYYLAKAGYKVLLIDYQQFPRDKVCGDFVGPVAIRELEAMGISQQEAFQKTNLIDRAAAYLDGKILTSRPIPRIEGIPDHGRVIPREIFDNWLFEAARKQGARVASPCRLTSFTVYKHSVQCICKMGAEEVTFTTRMLIGADGSSSTVARIMNGGKPDAHDRIVAVRAYYENIDCIPRQAELYFTSKSFPGYYWVFPTGPSTANVGLGMVLDNFPKEEINLKELLLDLVASDTTLKKRIGNGRLKDKIVGWPLSTYNPKAKLTADRVMLIGDAAGLINALNGEGIQYAIQSGRWAAESLLSSLAMDDLSANGLKNYEKVIKDRLGYDMSLSNLIVQFLRNRNLNALWLSTLAMMSERADKDESYANIAGGILAGLVPSSEALSISFVSKSALQGFTTLADSSITALKQGPLGILAMGLQTAGDMSEQLSNLFQQPDEYWEWSRGLFIKTLQLSAYIVRDITEKLLVAD